MTWRRTLGFVDDESPVVDMATAQQRYLKLRDRPDRPICERRRLKQALEQARREMANRKNAHGRTRYL